jgi:ribosome-binding factor A
MWSRRIERVNELLLEEVSRIVMERQDPDVGFVTFTGVEVSEDLSTARVYFSVLGSEEDRGRTLEALERLRPEFGRQMRRLESLKRVPHLNFEYDATPERAARVFELLEKIHQEKQSDDTPPAESGKSRRRSPRGKNAKTTQRKRSR